MILLLALLIAQLPAGSVQQHSVRIELTVQTHEYEWTVANEGAAPITAVTIPAYRTHSHEVPPGWSFEYVDDEFRCRADTPHAAIGPGRRQTFFAHLSVHDTVLGERPAVIAFAGSDAPVSVTGVRTSVPRPRSMLVIIPVTMLALALLHVFLAQRSCARVGR
jgi:hypothetical protein